MAEVEPAKISTEQQGDATLEVRLSGAFTFEASATSQDTGLQEIPEFIRRVILKDEGITTWDSALLILLMEIKQRCVKQEVELDLSGLPKGPQQLIQLASEVPEHKSAPHDGKRDSFIVRVGKKSQTAWDELMGFVTFLGDVTISVGRLLTGRAQFRRSELWAIIQECGPHALGIVTIISVLVGAILAFVGAMQLQMFGAQILVANLVGMGMVVEMGALMTGIILAGRTGAAFAAQIGTMQVNEEVDALRTMGINPMDYLVLPRLTALVLMTPLLVIYADVLGILGGSIIGIFALDIPPVLFFNQTLSSITLWHCAQGLIKGSTFGLLIAISGCLRGMQCGRSASAVGEAATSAVVSGIVMIVVADAIWTYVFMTLGGL
jgi:phospholipid/cholesterol/gamma-HCH transport system permease protein